MNTLALTEICHPGQPRQLSKKSLSAHGYPVYGANGIIGYHTEYNREQSVITIAGRGNSCGKVHLTQPRSYVTSNALCLENTRNDIDTEYVYYYLKQYDFSPLISGAAQPQLTIKQLRHIRVPLLPLSRQKEIAATLKKAEQCITQRQEQLKLLSTLKSAYFTEEMNRIETAEKFTRYTLGDITHIQCGKRNANEAADNGKFPFFTCAKSPRRINSHHFNCECVLVSGNTDFHVQYYKGKFDAYQRIYVIETADASTAIVPFLFAWLEYCLPRLQQQAIGGVMPYLRRSMLTQLPILVPTLRAQRKMATVLHRIQQTKANAQKALAQETLLFEKLLHQYFQEA